MPIFGSLCGNDYIDLVRYNELRIYISNFKSSKKFESVNIIKDFYFKKVTIFLLQMNENIKQGNNYNNKIYKYQKNIENQNQNQNQNDNDDNDMDISKYDDLSNFQKLIIKEIFKDTHNIINPKHRLEFQKNFIDSVREYNPNRKIQTIINNIDIEEKLKKNKFLYMDKKILEKYYMDSQLPIKGK